MPEAKTGRRAAAPRFDELVARAEALIPVLRERAERAEELRRLPDETIADLHSSGLFRMLQPARVGGSELPYRALFELSAVIGQGCGSTAWVLANLAAHHWLLGMWHPEAQDEIWGESPDNLIGSALIFPRGRARRVPGGYRLSGRWPFSSGIDAATWDMFGAIVIDEETGQSEPRIFLLPASDYKIIDTWQVIGLSRHRQQGCRGRRHLCPGLPHARRPSGSRAAPIGAAGSIPGRCTSCRRSACSALRSPASRSASPAARSSISPRRRAPGSALIPGGTSPISRNLQVHLAEAAASADAAEAIVLRDCDEATRITEAGVVPSLEQRARYRRDGAFAATLCTRAVDILFSATGGSAIYARNPIQRAFRDVHAANAHYMLTWDVNGAIYGRVALGLPPEASL